MLKLLASPPSVPIKEATARITFTNQPSVRVAQHLPEAYPVPEGPLPYPKDRWGKTENQILSPLCVPTGALTGGISAAARERIDEFTRPKAGHPLYCSIYSCVSGWHQKSIFREQTKSLLYCFERLQAMAGLELNPRERETAYLILIANFYTNKYISKLPNPIFQTLYAKRSDPVLPTAQPREKTQEEIAEAELITELVKFVTSDFDSLAWCHALYNKLIEFEKMYPEHKCSPKALLEGELPEHLERLHEILGELDKFSNDTTLSFGACNDLLLRLEDLSKCTSFAHVFLADTESPFVQEKLITNDKLEKLRGRSSTYQAAYALSTEWLSSLASPISNPDLIKKAAEEIIVVDDALKKESDRTQLLSRCKGATDPSLLLESYQKLIAHGVKWHTLSGLKREQDIFIIKIASDFNEIANRTGAALDKELAARCAFEARIGSNSHALYPYIKEWENKTALFQQVPSINSAHARTQFLTLALILTDIKISISPDKLCQLCFGLILQGINLKVVNEMISSSEGAKIAVGGARYDKNMKLRHDGTIVMAHENIYRQAPRINPGDVIRFCQNLHKLGEYGIQGTASLFAHAETAFREPSRLTIDGFFVEAFTSQLLHHARFLDSQINVTHVSTTLLSGREYDALANHNGERWGVEIKSSPKALVQSYAGSSSIENVNLEKFLRSCQSDNLKPVIVIGRFLDADLSVLQEFTEQLKYYHRNGSPKAMIIGINAGQLVDLSVLN